MNFKVRKAIDADIKDVAVILGLGVKVDMPFLPVLHTEEEDFNYTKNTIFKKYEVWVATDDKNKILGFTAFKDSEIHQLFILNAYHNKGIGTALLNKAKEKFDHLTLWTFQKNTQARDFYENKGFKILKLTDGLDNDEKEPDVYYEWKRNIE